MYNSPFIVRLLIPSQCECKQKIEEENAPVMYGKLVLQNNPDEANNNNTAPKGMKSTKIFAT